MRYLFTIVLSLMIFGLSAQEQNTIIELSVDEKSCSENVQYQFNLQVCEPVDLETEEVMGYQESKRDWSKFSAIDNNFECKTNLSESGCKARFRLDDYALNKVLNISVVQIDGNSMEMMQLLVPITEAHNQTVISLTEIPFESKSVNLVDKLKNISNMVRENVIVLQPAVGTF